MELLDYRDLPEDEPFDKIASVGMFEHVGRAQLPAYFAKIHRLLEPGGLLMNHGITAGGTRNDAARRRAWRLHRALHLPRRRAAARLAGAARRWREAGSEPLDVENLRPHYARTLWAWSDALEAQLDAARAHRRASAWCAPTGSTWPAAR